MGPWLLLSSRSYFGQISHVASKIWNDVQLSPLQLVWWWYADVFARWRLEPIVAVVVVVVAVQVRNPRRADAVARCLRINIYMKYTAAFALGTSLPARIATHKLPPPELGKAQSWESEWLPTMGSHAGFLKMQPGTSPSTLAQKKSNGNQCVFPVAFFLQLEAQSVKKIGKKNEKNAK